ncbi:hypothetical protein PGT21_009033 [Puccinia graminis f. sp. tritici]|uniref:Uncharacterized protein n=1 Tax=Puccinia graminis f. sp. tritici TaxID=56615 RepID=A0A5B0S7M5_PUCGR|nr:hypothetical protein PGT21_009033 [Puccinia graminis f. sp. tritici]KAA1134131.1 hypothetical protein PGTUg99_029218 [Puccinia graminis f. sp. tritici]
MYRHNSQSFQLFGARQKDTISLKTMKPVFMETNNAIIISTSWQRRRGSGLPSPENSPDEEEVPPQESSCEKQT